MPMNEMNFLCSLSLKEINSARTRFGGSHVVHHNSASFWHSHWHWRRAHDPRKVCAAVGKVAGREAANLNRSWDEVARPSVPRLREGPGLGVGLGGLQQSILKDR